MAVPTIRFHIRILEEPTTFSRDAMVQGMREAFATAGIGVEVATVSWLDPPNRDVVIDMDTGTCNMGQPSSEQILLFGDGVANWSGWVWLGGPPGGMVGPPATVSRNPAVCNVYARGADNALWQLAWFDGRWHGWGRHNDGGVMASHIAADSMGTNHEHVFVRGTDGAVWHKFWVGGQGWSRWFWLGAPPGGFIGAPTTISRNPGVANVYVRGADNALWQLAWANGRWHGWGRHNDGGVMASHIAADSMGPNHEHLFVRGTDGAVWQKWWLEGQGWSRWVWHGAPPGGFVGAPSTIARNSSVTNIYVRGSDNTLWQKAWFNGSWHGWGRHYDRGQMSAEPAPGAMAPGHEHVFIRGLDGALWQKWWFGANRNREVVVFFVRNVFDDEGGLNGCASFPSGQPGAVVANYASRWTLGHELGHVFGLPHMSGENCDQPGYQPTRLMTGCGTSNIVEPPPEVTSGEKSTVSSSPLIVMR